MADEKKGPPAAIQAAVAAHKAATDAPHNISGTGQVVPSRLPQFGGPLDFTGLNPGGNVRTNSRKISQN